MREKMNKKDYMFNALANAAGEKKTPSTFFEYTGPGVKEEIKGVFKGLANFAGVVAMIMVLCAALGLVGYAITGITDYAKKIDIPVGVHISIERK